MQPLQLGRFPLHYDTQLDAILTCIRETDSDLSLSTGLTGCRDADSGVAWEDDAGYRGRRKFGGRQESALMALAKASHYLHNIEKP
jgi:hypothetical protein